MIEIPEFNREATFGDIMPASIQIAESGDKELAAEYVDKYVEYLVQDWDRTPEDALKVVLNNIGYWAGYYGYETMKLVNDFYGAVHPIFGLTSPTPEEAVEAGKRLATER